MPVNSSETSENWTFEECILAFDLCEAQDALRDHVVARNQGALENWMPAALRCNSLNALPRHEIANKLLAWQLSRETGSPSL